MSESSIAYDVAFSFLKEDEALAVELNDLIQDRLETFLYSRRQSELAGTDGEESFAEVFGRDSRIVVVLYRDGWGETPWTRIEKTAIRNRAYEQGYDFLLFAPLDDTPHPKWLPKTQIWIGIDRWGPAGAAAVIEARAQEAGGVPRPETVEDKAARLKRAMDFDTERKRFLNSERGVAAAKEEAERLYEILASKVSAISEASGFPLKFERLREGCEVRASFGCMAVDWCTRFANTLNESELRISLWGGTPPRFGRMHFHEPRHLREQLFEFDQTRSGSLGWRAAERTEILSSDQVADQWLGNLMQHAHDKKHQHPR